jgi:hypothetical protein
MWRVWEAREEVKEDSPVLGGKGNELGTWVLVSGRCRGQDVGTGDEWGFETKSPKTTYQVQARTNNVVKSTAPQYGRQQSFSHMRWWKKK